ncbi:MAG: 5-formyltetrahydrofolate cyclo-ligase [Pseudomonadota bacterium]
MSQKKKQRIQDKKEKLRQAFNSARASHTSLQKNLIAHRQLTALKRTSAFKRAKRIALYYSVNNEACTQLIFEHALRSGKQCFLPCIQDDKHMHFKAHHRTTPLTQNRYRIPEPRFGKRVHSRHMDLVITPLTSVDSHGTRIGMGGGYYDRTFAFKQRARHTQLIGLSSTPVSQQRLPKDPWDIQLDGVLTPSTFLKTKKSAKH